MVGLNARVARTAEIFGNEYRDRVLDYGNAIARALIHKQDGMAVLHNRLEF